jgi:hypothetical protein
MDLIFLSTIFLLKNFFSGFVMELSSIDVAATRASEVSLNFPKAFNFTLPVKDKSIEQSASCEFFFRTDSGSRNKFALERMVC